MILVSGDTKAHFSNMWTDGDWTFVHRQFTEARGHSSVRTFVFMLPFGALRDISCSVYHSLGYTWTNPALTPGQKGLCLASILTVDFPQPLPRCFRADQSVFHEQVASPHWCRSFRHGRALSTTSVALGPYNKAIKNKQPKGSNNNSCKNLPCSNRDKQECNPNLKSHALRGFHTQRKGILFIVKAWFWA